MMCPVVWTALLAAALRPVPTTQCSAEGAGKIQTGICVLYSCTDLKLINDCDCQSRQELCHHCFFCFHSLKCVSTCDFWHDTVSYLQLFCVRGVHVLHPERQARGHAPHQVSAAYVWLQGLVLQKLFFVCLLTCMSSCRLLCDVADLCI